MPKFYTPMFVAPVVANAPSQHIADLQREEAAREARREQLRCELEAARAENARLRKPAAPVPPAPIAPAADTVSEFQRAQIDAMVALYVAEGLVSYDVATDQYVRPRSAVWCFDGAKPWAL